MPQNLAARRKKWQVSRVQPNESDASTSMKQEITPEYTSNCCTRQPTSHCTEQEKDTNTAMSRMDEARSTVSCRRQSILYTSNTSVDDATMHAGGECHHARERSESHFITPFAQILSIMKRVHAALLLYKQAMEMNVTEELEDEATEHKSQDIWPLALQEAAIELHDMFGEFDWCLRVLEGLECRRSVSSLTMKKFCSILSRELSTSLSMSDNVFGVTVNKVTEDVDQNEEAVSITECSQTGSSVDASQERLSESRPYLSHSGNKGHFNTQSTASSQICDYIYRTFVEDDEVADLELTAAVIGEDVKRVEDHADGGTNNPSVVVPCKNGADYDSNTNHDLVRVWKEAECTFDSQIVLNFIQTYQDSYAPDLFVLHTLSDHHTLSTFGMSALMRRNILKKLLIPAKTMHTCLTQIEALYNQIAPFHNSVHATDVLLTMDYLFRINKLESSFADLEIFATLFACAVHDIDHPAVTNQYLINTGNELALLYNDSSVLENHHLHVAFNLLCTQPECDVTKYFTAQQRALFRKMVISLVLSTDMSKHMTLLAGLKTTLESQRAAGFDEFPLDGYSSRIQLLQCLVHAADLSNPTKPLPIYKQWVDRITEEMFQQGDRERVAGLEISPMCNRQIACVEANQISFIDYVVYPLWETISELVHPEAAFILDTIQENREWFSSSKLPTSSS